MRGDASGEGLFEKSPSPVPPLQKLSPKGNRLPTQGRTTQCALFVSHQRVKHIRFSAANIWIFCGEKLCNIRILLHLFPLPIRNICSRKTARTLRRRRRAYAFDSLMAMLCVGESSSCGTALTVGESLSHRRNESSRKHLGPTTHALHRVSFTRWTIPPASLRLAFPPLHKGGSWVRANINQKANEIHFFDLIALVAYRTMPPLCKGGKARLWRAGGIVPKRKQLRLALWENGVICCKQQATEGA